MVFCGHCGLQLAPGDAVCPRCGSIVEDELPDKDPHVYDPTIASISRPPASPPTPPTALPAQGSYTPPQQKLVLRPGGSGPGFGPPAASDPTSMMTAQGSAAPPTTPQGRISHPDYFPQSGSNYPQPQTSYPLYPPTETVGYAQMPGQFDAIQHSPPLQRRRGRNGALLVVLLLLLLLLASVVVFVARPGLLKGLLGNNTTGTPTIATTPADEARSLIQQYYADINKQDYQDAYNLWGSAFHKQQSYNDFANGYAQTKHDDVTIDSLTTNADGTVTANITIVAQEERASGPVTSTYKGIYTIGQENGAWKFLRGSFNAVAS